MQVSTFFFLNGVVFDFYQLIIDYWIGIIGFPDYPRDSAIEPVGGK